MDAAAGWFGVAERADTEVCARFTRGAWAVSEGRWRAGMTGAIMNALRPRSARQAPTPNAAWYRTSPTGHAPWNDTA